MANEANRGMTKKEKDLLFLLELTDKYVDGKSKYIYEEVETPQEKEMKRKQEDINTLLHLLESYW